MPATVRGYSLLAAGLGYGLPALDAATQVLPVRHSTTLPSTLYPELQYENS